VSINRQLQGIKIDQSSLQKSIQRQVERAIENQVGQIENLISEKLDQQAKQHFAWAMMGFCLLLLLTIFYLLYQLNSSKKTIAAQNQHIQQTYTR